MTNREIFEKNQPFNYNHRSFKGLIIWKEDGTLKSWDVPNIPKPDAAQFAKWKSENEQKELDKKWDDIRKRRNELLKACDYMLISDFPIITAMKTKWKAYRVLLRDLPAANENPDLIEFPNDPDYIEPGE